MKPKNWAARSSSFCNNVVTFLDQHKSLSTGAYSNIRHALGKPSTNGLLYPKNVCKFGPAVFISGRLGLTVTPRKRLNAKVWICQRDKEWEPTPFSCSRPSREEHPGPPLVLNSEKNIVMNSEVESEQSSHQNIKSSTFPPSAAGKNQKKSYEMSFKGARKTGILNEPTLRVSFLNGLMGRSPAQLGPTSKSTSGILSPST